MTPLSTFEFNQVAQTLSLARPMVIKSAVSISRHTHAHMYAHVLGHIKAGIDHNRHHLGGHDDVDAVSDEEFDTDATNNDALDGDPNAQSNDDEDA